MIKKTLLVAFAALLASSAMADTLTPQQALDRALSSEGKRLVNTAVKPTLAYTVNTEKGDAAVYVFNRDANGGGVLILSADDMAVPMLGYTDNGGFDPSNIPPQMKYWLSEYAREIEFARSKGIEVKSESVALTFPSSWTPIPPLCATNWDQGAPYSNDTPFNWPTGCLATCMAQVMKYWNYPEKGTGSISYEDMYGNTLSMNFAEQPFEWDKMLNNYVSGKYTKEEAAAVAYLMKACGYSTEMSYSSQSGTQAEMLGIALMEYFGYEKGISQEQRSWYSTTDWNNLVYTQLKDYGPVPFAATSTLGGHSFVCDGYDGSGYFHFNWGWGGMCNGYYLLNALNPTSQGSGGFYGGYNFWQSITTGIKPSTGASYEPKPVSLSISTSLTATISRSTLSLSLADANSARWANDGLVRLVNPEIGIAITNAEGTSEPNYIVCSLGGSIPEMAPGSYIDGTTITPVATLPSSLENGKYRVTIVSRNNDGNTSPWVPMYHAYDGYNYIYVTKDGSNITVENMPYYRFSMKSAEIATSLYYNNPCLVKMEVTNPYDIEITQAIVPLLYKDGKLQYIGDSENVTLMPHETASIEMNCSFQKDNGATIPTVSNPTEFDFKVAAYVEYTYRVKPNNQIEWYYKVEREYGDFGTVTMRRSSAQVKVSSRGLKIANANEEGQAAEGYYLYGISNFSAMEVEASVMVQGGFAASPLTAVIYELDPVTLEVGNQVYEKDFPEMFFLGDGDTATLTCWINFDNYDLSKTYQLTVYYLSSQRRVALSNCRFAASSGVDGIQREEGDLNLAVSRDVLDLSSEAGLEAVVLYDVNGAVVDNVNLAGQTAASVDLSSLSMGIYVVKVSDFAGHVKTTKILK